MPDAVQMFDFWGASGVFCHYDSIFFRVCQGKYRYFPKTLLITSKILNRALYTGRSVSVMILY